MPIAASAPPSIQLKVSALYPPQLSAQGQFFLTKDLGSRCKPSMYIYFVLSTGDDNDGWNDNKDDNVENKSENQDKDSL